MVFNRIAKLLRIPIGHLRAKYWRLRHSDFLFVFNWHQISPNFDSSRHHEYTWTRFEDFKVEVDYLRAEFQILPLYEAIDRFKRRCLHGPCVSLTFDDGDISMAEHVLPYMHQHNMPATFFINSAYLDGKRTYWFPVLAYFSANEDARRQANLPDGLLEKVLQLRRTNDVSFYNEVRSCVEQFASFIPNLGSRLVSTEWLTSLDGEQFTIGAHGHEHQRFSMMLADWQRNDLRENVRHLSQFRAYRPIFAVPFGREYDWTDETLKNASSLGLEVVLADGGVNISPGKVYRRIPADGKKLRPLIRDVLARQ
jgi:peptidoglycan/xylan/chitin deacetylase (PgdA/CDA1 family)